MAVYTHLRSAQLKAYARQFGLGTLHSFAGVGKGTINTIYDLHTDQGRFILRILEDRSKRDALFEQTLVRHLGQANLCIAALRPPIGRSPLLSLSPRQHVAVFEFVEGKELQRHRLKSKHTDQIGEFLARMHLAARSLRRQKQNAFGPDKMKRLAAACAEKVAQEKSRFGHEHRKAIRVIQRNLKRYPIATPACPAHIIHGDLFVDNALFKKDRLSGVLDFEMASSGAWIYDIAVALNDWAFTDQGTIELPRARALLDGYQRVRTLEGAEKKQLYTSLAYALTRFCLTRIYDFEITLAPGADRLYKDFREIQERLAHLEGIGSRHFQRDLFA